MGDPQPFQKGQKCPAKQLRRWTVMANFLPQANVSTPAQPPLCTGYLVYDILSIRDQST